MRHARADYDRIQDPAGRIPDDEPVFLLRGQDPIAHVAVRAWAKMLEDQGGDARMIEAARNHADRMAEWARARGKARPDLLN